MKRTIAIAAVLLGLVTATGPATAGQQTAAPSQSAAAAAAVLPDGVTIAVTGTDGRLWSRSGTDTRWTNLGGDLLGAPAVLVAPEADVVHYVAQGTNGGLYHRTDTAGWHRLTPAAAVCGQPAMDSGADLSGDVDVVVGCRGANGALYRLDFPLTETTPTSPG